MQRAVLPILFIVIVCSITLPAKEVQAVKRGFTVVGCTKDLVAVRAFVKNVEPRDFAAIKRGFVATAARYSKSTVQQIIRGQMSMAAQDRIFAQWVAASGGKMKLENWSGKLQLNSKESFNKLQCR
ncbi:hypothetical protein [Pararhizobium sp.]|uniref:hypothetical protein n=1 Tax=Pararhizobium sp. TaxID=1977563 RepID=UPI0027265CF5|nr:hypothetical protein [Pararhizobium sp.]MDO9416032.1 hypothetical protein [Pararhizobium sp.]